MTMRFIFVWFAMLMLSACATQQPRVTAPVVIEERVGDRQEEPVNETTSQSRPEPAGESIFQTDANDPPGNAVLHRDQRLAIVTPPPSVSLAPRNVPLKTISSLLTAASLHKQAGRFDQAAATLERALRVDPQSAEVWYRLADVRFAQTRYPQAEQFAVKSNTFASADIELQAKNWRLIGRVRERSGDAAGASLAYAKAQELERQ